MPLVTSLSLFKGKRALAVQENTLPLQTTTNLNMKYNYVDMALKPFKRCYNNYMEKTEIDFYPFDQLCLQIFKNITYALSNHILIPSYVMA